MSGGELPTSLLRIGSWLLIFDSGTACLSTHYARDLKHVGLRATPAQNETRFIDSYRCYALMEAGDLMFNRLIDRDAPVGTLRNVSLQEKDYFVGNGFIKCFYAQSK